MPTSLRQLFVATFFASINILSSALLGMEEKNSMVLEKKFAQLCIAEKAKKQAKLAMQPVVVCVDISPSPLMDDSTQATRQTIAKEIQTSTQSIDDETQTNLEAYTTWSFFSKSKKEDPTNADQSLTEKTLIQLINKEKNYIRAALFEFNLYKVAYALCKAHERGIPVEIIMNGSRGTKRSVAQLLVQRCGIPIRYYTPTNAETHEGGGILHTKMFIFESNDGMAYLNEAKHKDSAVNYCTPLFWTGSTNIAGNAVEKNMETSSVLADTQSVEEAIERFKTIWRAAEEQAKTEKKLNDLESVEFNDTDLKINGVPSVNALYLLQSQFLRQNQGGGTNFTHLTPAEILNNQDFVPTSEERSGTNTPRILPRGLALPKATFLCVGQDLKTYVYGIDNQWYNLHDDLVVEHKIKLHGIGKSIEPDQKWFFRTEKDRHVLYYTLADLQTDTESLAQQKFHGPFIQDSRGNFDYAPLSRLRKEETYSLTQLQITASAPQIHLKDGSTIFLEKLLRQIK